MSGDMGSCLGLITKLGAPGEAPDVPEEQLDGASPAPSDPLLALETLALDGGPNLEPELPITMTPKQVKQIMDNLDSIVMKTNGVTIVRISEKLRSYGVPIRRHELISDNDQTKTLIRQFYMDIQRINCDNTFDQLSRACAELNYHEINRYLAPLTTSPLRPVTRQLSEDPDAGQTNLGAAGDINGADEVDREKETVMTEEQRNLIINNYDDLSEHISSANLKMVVKCMSSFITPEKYNELVDNSIDLKKRIMAFFGYVIYMKCHEPYKQVATAFMNNNRDVHRILSMHYPRPAPASNSTGARPILLVENDLLNVNPEVATAIKEGAYGDDVEVNLEAFKSVETRGDINFKRIRVKQAKVRMDLDEKGQVKEEIYRCGTNPKGLALVINIHSYPDFRARSTENESEPETERRGSEHDRRDITLLFEELGYTVTNFPANLADLVTAESFKKTIMEFAQSTDHYYVNSCFVVIMAHGVELSTSGRGNAIICSDSKTVPLTWIHEQFSSKMCQFLIGKPKVFIYQSCRGVEVHTPQTNAYEPPVTSSGMSYDGKGIVVVKEVEAPSLKFERMLDDMLVCHAAPQGAVAQRCSKNGAIFIQTIVDIFTQFSHEMHVRKMMEEVDKRIKMKCNAKFSQTTSYESIGFTRKLYLHPHLYDSDLNNGGTEEIIEVEEISAADEVD